MKFLLDTATLIDAVKGRLPVVLRLQQLRPGDVAVSRISCMEAEIALRRAPRASAKFTRLLREFLAAVRVLDFGAPEAQQAVALAPYLDADAPSGLDLQVASTALAHQLTLVTPSQKRFALLPGLETESWTQ